jgi:enamine deaminase RidA (YjgF/YER057c/UK114 family)
MRNAINTAGAAVVGPYSQAVEVDGVLYLSGQTPLDPAINPISIRAPSGRLATPIVVRAGYGGRSSILLPDH